MTAKSAGHSFMPLLIVFFLTGLLFVLGRKWLESRNLDVTVLMIGNLVLFAATALSFYLYNKSIQSKNAYGIVRMIYGSVLARMLVCLVAVFVYLGFSGKNINKEAIFGCMFLYVVYSVIEVSALLKLSKQNRNA